MHKFFLFLLLIFVDISAQINLNNFGNLEILNTYSGFNKLLFHDINNDGIKDIFLYGNKSKSFVFIEGLEDNSFAKPSKKFFFYPIDEIKWFNKTKEGTDYYLFISRNLKLAGLVSFTKSNSLMLLNTFEFNSYPSNIKITDLNNDRKNEAIIYGTNFDGLALITNDGFKLNIKNIVDQKVFSDVVLLDLNQDGYDDLITLDFIDNALVFYDNLTKFKFSALREIEFDEIVSKIKKVNFNSDDFDDLILLKERGSEILLGDSVFSFSQNLNYNFPFKAKDVLITDVNRDSYNDIILLNEKDNQIRIIFDTNKEEKYIDYNFSGVSSINSVQFENDKSLLLNSKNGKIFFLNTAIKWGNSFNFFVGGKFSKIKSIKNKNSLFTQAVLNHENYTLNTLQLNTEHKFTSLSSFEFITPIDNFEEKIEKNLFAGYSKGGRNIELLNISLPKLAGISNNLIYSEFPIQHIEIDDNLNIVALQNVKNQLYAQSFINKNKNYSAQKPVLIDSLVVASYLNKLNDYYFWVKEGNTLILKRLFENEKLNLTKINLDNDFLKSVIFIGRVRANILEQFMSIVKTSEKDYIFLITENSAKSIRILQDIFTADNLNEKNFWIFKSPQNILFLYNYDAENMKIYEFTYNSFQNILEKTLTIEGIKSNDYFIEKFSLNRYLVYCNSELNCVSYKLMR